MLADMPEQISDRFQAYQGPQRAMLKDLRKLILETAQEIDAVGHIEETLKWGQPSFLTVRPKTGSTVRIDTVKGSDDTVGVYFICHTGLVDRFKEIYPDKFEIKGNRELLFNVHKPLPIKELKHCIAMALTYHLP